MVPDLVVRPEAYPLRDGPVLLGLLCQLLLDLESFLRRLQSTDLKSVTILAYVLQALLRIPSAKKRSETTKNTGCKFLLALLRSPHSYSATTPSALAGFCCKVSWPPGSDEKSLPAL